MSKRKIPTGSKEELRAAISTALSELRSDLGYSQKQMAEALAVSQGQIAKWENQKLTMPGQVMARVAKLADDEDSTWWLYLAGLEVLTTTLESDIRRIPLLRDSAAAGTPRAVDEKEIEEMLTLPRSWVRKGGSLFAVRIKGDSMSPILESGYVVFIDVAARTASKLVNRMVAAREGEETTIKWLRHQDPHYLLVPQNTSPRHPVRIMTREGDFGIVGEVVLWIGEPPAPRKG